MASIAEIEGYRVRISQALELARGVEKGPYPTWDTLPPNFYNPRQLECFRKADATIERTVEGFMGELGIAWRLSRTFRKISIPFLPWAGNKDMWYTLKFGEVPFKDEVHVSYLPGSWGGEESLYIHSIPVLVPLNKKDSSRVMVSEAVKYLHSLEAHNVSYPALFTDQITKEEIRSMLTLVVSDPNLHIPVLVK